MTQGGGALPPLTRRAYISLLNTHCSWGLLLGSPKGVMLALPPVQELSTSLSEEAAITVSTHKQTRKAIPPVPARQGWRAHLVPIPASERHSALGNLPLSGISPSQAFSIPRKVPCGSESRDQTPSSHLFPFCPAQAGMSPPPLPGLLHVRCTQVLSPAVPPARVGSCLSPPPREGRGSLQALLCIAWRDTSSSQLPTSTPL